jgi:hypothetical protein
MLRAFWLPSVASMTTHTTTGAAVTTRDHSTLALILGLLSVPGSILTWDLLPGGGFVWGAPVALAAVVLGVQSRSQGRGKAIAGIVLGGAMLAMMLVWTVVASLG